MKKPIKGKRRLATLRKLRIRQRSNVNNTESDRERTQQTDTAPTALASTPGSRGRGRKGAWDRGYDCMCFTVQRYTCSPEVLRTYYLRSCICIWPTRSIAQHHTPHPTPMQPYVRRCTCARPFCAYVTLVLLYTTKVAVYHSI